MFGEHTADTLLGALVFLFAGLLGWLAKLFFGHTNPESKMHQTRDERDVEMKLASAELKAHADLDSQQFKQIEAKLNEMSEDIKQLLKRRQSGARRK